MATSVESDIDQFIQNQKAKLQQERQLLADDERGERLGRRHWDDPARETQYAEQLIPKGTIMVRNHTMYNPSIVKQYDYAEAKKELQKERREDYEKYLQKYHHDLIPLLSTPAYQIPPQRHFIRKSPSIHPREQPQFSFNQFEDMRVEVSRLTKLTNNNKINY